MERAIVCDQFQDDWDVEKRVCRFVRLQSFEPLSRSFLYMRPQVPWTGDLNVVNAIGCYSVLSVSGGGVVHKGRHGQGAEQLPALSAGGGRPAQEESRDN